MYRIVGNIVASPSKIILLVLFPILPIIGFICGVEYQKNSVYPSETVVENGSTSASSLIPYPPSPTSSQSLITILSPSPTPVPRINFPSIFQKALYDHCRDSQIEAAALPIQIDVLKMKDMLTGSDTENTILSCFLDPLKGGDVSINYAGNPLLSIYDDHSPEPQCLLCESYRDELHTSATLTNINNDTRYTIFGPLSDDEFEAEQSEIWIMGVKTLHRGSIENIYVRYKIQGMHSDTRLINLMKKYSKYDKAAGKYYVDRNKYSEYTEEIKNTFFPDLTNLQKS